MLEQHSLINDIYIENNRIYFDFNNSEINQILMKSKSLDIYFEFERDNSIDLVKLLSENGEIILKKTKYLLFSSDSNGDERKLYFPTFISNKGGYIAKNLKINTIKNQYIISLYVDLNYNLMIEVKPEPAINKKEYIVDMEGFTISSQVLKLDLKVSKLSNGDDCADEEKIDNKIDTTTMKLLLVGKSNRDTIYLDAINVIDNKVHFTIDLIKLLKEYNYKIKPLLMIDGNPYWIKGPDKLNLRIVELYNHNNFKCLKVIKDKLGNILLDINLKLKVCPVISELKYLENFYIKGNINSNLNIFHHPSINTYLQLISGDGKFNQSYIVELKNQIFSIEIPKEDLLILKDSFPGNWKMELISMYNNVPLIKSGIFANSKGTKLAKRKVLFNKELDVDTQILLSKIIIERNSKTVQLNLKNNITISKILSVTIKKHKLQVKFRTLENLEKLSNINTLISNLIVNGMKLSQDNIKIIGKKTFVCEYTTDDPEYIADYMYKKGVNVEVLYDNRLGRSFVNDIDKDTIYHTFWQKVQASKKYKLIVRRIYKNVLTKLPMKNNWIVYESFLGRNMSDSPKYIFEYLEKEYGDKYKHIWVFNNKRDDLPDYIKQVKRFSFQHLYYIARSKFWINNMRQPVWFIKREKQIFLATWHGTPLKKLVFDIEEIHSANKDYKQEFYTQSRVWDYLLSANKYSTQIFRRAFRFDNPILELGYPRNDLLYSNDINQLTLNIKKKLGIPLDKKIVLYAPTWRDDEVLKPGKYKFDLVLDLKRLRKELGNEYFFVLRTHYFISNYIDVDGLEDFVYNASNYDDVTELYLISDVLITDYSSVFFDYANLKRPILFFTYDLEKYRDVLRGFYLDLETEGPGPIVMNNDEIINQLRDFNKLVQDYKLKLEQFHERFCSWDDGEATKRIAEYVIVKNSD